MTDCPYLTYLTLDDATVWHGDSLEQLRRLPDACVDSIVTDPPYGLSFMGKRWDYDVPSVELWAECLRVLKPGGHLLAFAGTRTQHRMAVRIEDAGFEIRDMIAWVYGSGFPKSLDVSKAIDKARDDRDEILRVTTFLADAAEAADVSRADVDASMGTSDMGGWWLSRLRHRCQCPKWDQWLRLKVILSLGGEMDAEVWRLNGRKGTPGNARADREVSAPGGNDVYQPTQRVLNAGTPVLDAARQWSGWGTALKPALEPITVARKPLDGTVAANVMAHGTGALNIDGCRVGESGARNNGKKVDSEIYGKYGPTERVDYGVGRWPANLIHDGSDEVRDAFPATSSGARAAGKYAGTTGSESLGDHGVFSSAAIPASSGSAARFFYCAKASKRDRDAGNAHPTVKPTDLMRYLCRLVTPPGGLVLDPFTGSGSTGKAARLEGFRFLGVEREAEYVELARARIAAVRP